MRQFIALTLFVFLVTPVVCAATRPVVQNTNIPAAGLVVGKTAPNIKLTDINGKPILIGGNSKRTQVILSVISLDNKITRIEVNRMEFLARQFKDIQFIVISQQTPAALSNSASRYKLKSLLLISDRKSKTQGSTQQHSLYMIDPSGKLIQSQVIQKPNTLVNFEPIYAAISKLKRAQ